MIKDIWDFFELSSSPFDNSLNQSFYFDTPTHSEALKSLEYAVESNKGIALIYGLPGTGKTFLAHAFKTQALKQGQVIFECDQLLRNEEQFLTQLAAKLKIKSDSHEHESLSDAIKTKLLELAKRGKNFIIMIDEAQEMQGDFFSILRSVNNIESEDKKLTQILLLAQPTIIDKLASPEFDSLRQRIGFKQELLPLTRQETIDYVQYRIEMADGDEERTIFRESAINLIFDATNGIPRLINEVCGNCLVAAFHKNKRMIGDSIVRRALESSLTFSIENRAKINSEKQPARDTVKSYPREPAARPVSAIHVASQVTQANHRPGVYQPVLTPAVQEPSMQNRTTDNGSISERSWLKDNYHLLVLGLAVIITLQFFISQMNKAPAPAMNPAAVVPRNTNSKPPVSVVTESVAAQQSPSSKVVAKPADQEESDGKVRVREKATYDYFELEVPKTE